MEDQVFVAMTPTDTPKESMQSLTIWLYLVLSVPNFIVNGMICLVQNDIVNSLNCTAFHVLINKKLFFRIKNITRPHPFIVTYTLPTLGVCI